MGGPLGGALGAAVEGVGDAMNVRVTREDTPHRSTLYTARAVSLEEGHMVLTAPDGEEAFFDVADAKVEIDTESGGDDGA